MEKSEAADPRFAEFVEEFDEEGIAIGFKLPDS